jgi:hypothetical protein
MRRYEKEDFGIKLFIRLVVYSVILFIFALITF